MQVMDIVNEAALASGAVPSFNIDEVPEDVQAIASTFLRKEIVTSMNCDRNLDITEAIARLHPVNGVIDLMCPPQEYPNEIYGTVPLTSKQLLQPFTVSYGGQDYQVYSNLSQLLVNMGLCTVDPGNPLGLTHTTEWPTDSVGNPRNIAIWTDDWKLIEIESGSEIVPSGVRVHPFYNVPFPPMWVEEVYRAYDGARLEPKKAGEFVSAQYRHCQLVYMVEGYTKKFRVRFTSSYGNSEALLVVPVPIQIVNSYEEPHPWQGELIAPEKFRPYIVSRLAARLAHFYNIDGADNLDKDTGTYYQSLLKNKTTVEHKADVPRLIGETLRNGGGFRVGPRGYSGGFYG